MSYVNYTSFVTNESIEDEEKETSPKLEAVILGSNLLVALVKKYNTAITLANQKWRAFQLKTLPQAKEDLISFKADGNKLKVLVIQTHAYYGQINLFPGPDGVIETKGHPINERPKTDDEPLKGFQIHSYYLKEKETIDSMTDGVEKDKAKASFHENDEAKKIDAFLDVVNEIEDGGTLILNACHIFGKKPTSKENDGLKFSDSLLALTGKRFRIIGPQDYVRESNINKTKNFGSGFIVKTASQRGYLDNSIETKKDLKLNGTGDKLYEFIPIE